MASRRLQTSLGPCLAKRAGKTSGCTRGQRWHFGEGCKTGVWQRGG